MSQLAAARFLIMLLPLGDRLQRTAQRRDQREAGALNPPLNINLSSDRFSMFNKERDIAWAGGGSAHG
jgi:hypothetical protein